MLNDEPLRFHWMMRSISDRQSKLSFELLNLRYVKVLQTDECVGYVLVVVRVIF